MKVALSYIEDVAAAAEKTITNEEIYSLLGKLDTAAQHVAKAREKDPTTVAIAYTSKKEPFEQTQDDLSSRILYLEAALSVVAAKLWPGGGGADKEGYSLLQRAKTAAESALRYRPRDPDYHYQLATIFKLLGDQKAALDAAHKALTFSPAHLPSIKFLDEAGGDWQPLWTDAPELMIPKKIPYKMICFAGGFIIFFFASVLSGPPRVIFAVGGLGLLIAGFMRWRFERSVEDSYRAYASARLDADISKLRRELHEDRYQREQEERYGKR